MIPITATDIAVTFTVYVQPRSSRAAIVGSHMEMLRIKLTAPPVGGAANKQCIQLLAKALGVPKSRIVIDAGQTSRKKRIRIQPGQTRWHPAEQAALVRKIRELAEKST